MLERMEKVDTVVVDKTGTLTEGKPAPGRGTARAWCQRDEIARGLRPASNRAANTPSPPRSSPGAKERGIDPARAEGFESVTGQGRTRPRGGPCKSCSATAR